jgi:PAS domain S-box-containing protein
MSSPERLAGFESSPIATWVSSFDPLRILWANQRALELWDARDLDELRGRDFSSVSETTLEQGRAWLRAFRDGVRDVIEVDWTLYPRGVPTRVHIFNSGIELDEGFVLLQQALLKTDPVDPAILRGAEAIRHISAAVASLSPTGAVLSRNPAMLHGFGLDTPPARWFDEPEVLANILAVADHGQVLRAEVSSRASGSRRDYALEARKTIDPVSGEDSILAHLLDETARLGAEFDAAHKGKLVAELEDALTTVEQQEQRWRALVESAPDPIMIIGRAHQIEFANRGLTPETSDAEVIGRRLEELFDPESHPPVVEAIERVFATGEIVALAASTSGPRGRLHHDLRLGPIGDHGQIERLMSISTDVTERRALEHQLRQSHKMQAVGTLAGGVAHDFNNLLMIILGACDLAALNAELAPQTRALLDEIAGAAERASGLTRQLLAFSRQQLLEARRLDLNELVAELSKLLARVLGDDITLVLDLDERGCWIVADPGQIEQVIMNLVVNARDAMPEGGRLTITTRATAPSEDELVLEISDTGVGIDPGLQARIFDPFFTTKDIGKGTGLGLSIVDGIVGQSDGRIELDSAPGRGARFTIYLPRLREAIAEPAVELGDDE